jgi:hypothetical protein
VPFSLNHYQIWPGIDLQIRATPIIAGLHANRRRIGADARQQPFDQQVQQERAMCQSERQRGGQGILVLAEKVKDAPHLAPVPQQWRISGDHSHELLTTALGQPIMRSGSTCDKQGQRFSEGGP